MQNLLEIECANRRNQNRLRTLSAANCEGTFGQSFEATTINLSDAGARLLTAAQVLVGDTFEMRTNVDCGLPAPISVAVQVEVVWVKEESDFRQNLVGVKRIRRQVA